MTEPELQKNLNRYYHLINILEKLVTSIEAAFLNDHRWFLYSTKITRKFIGHCKNLYINSSDAFVIEDGKEKIETQYIDIPGLFMNVRSQSDTYAILYHLFFDKTDWELRRLRFDLWRLDSIVGWVRQKNPFDYNEENNQINEIIDKILHNDVFKNLGESEKKFVFRNSNEIEKIFANWKFNLNKLTSKENKISWKEIFINSGLKGKMFENAHSFFSMYVHSNFFSVNHLINQSHEQTIKDKNFAITFSSFLIALTLDDFCASFEKGKEFASTITSLDLEIIKSFLIAARETEKIKYFA